DRGHARCGVPVRGKERGQCGDQLLWSLLGYPVSGTGKHYAFDVVGSEPHRCRDTFAAAFGPADRQDGHGQALMLPLSVLLDDVGEGPVQPEAPAQSVRSGCEKVDVVRDQLVWQLVRPGGGIELSAEEDLLASANERFVDLCRELVEGQMPK